MFFQRPFYMKSAPLIFFRLPRPLKFQRVKFVPLTCELFQVHLPPLPFNFFSLLSSDWSLALFKARFSTLKLSFNKISQKNKILTFKAKMNKLALSLLLLAVLCCSFLVSAKKDCLKKVYKCTAESRKGDACPTIYSPVCGHKPDIVCVTVPCNYVTYSNSCEACHIEDVESYTVGECTILG